MGRKKGKGKSQDDQWDEGDEKSPPGLDAMSTSEVGGDNPIINRGATGGQRKGRKKKAFEDIDADEVEAIAAEMGLDVKQDDKPSEEPGEQTTKPSVNEQEQRTAEGEVKEKSSSGASKTGKKSKKKKNKGVMDDEELEAVLREIEGEGPAADSQPQTTKPVETAASGADISKQNEVTPADSGAVAAEGSNRDEEETTSTVMTAAQKKAAKKEREKKKKEAARQAKQAQAMKKPEMTKDSQDSGTVSEKLERNESQEKDDDQVKSKVEESEVTKCEVGEKVDEKGEEGEGDEEQTEDKKKKKKKKKKEEEKPKTKTPGKAAISKIKKLKAALEEEQRRREEEALAAQREEEEKERKRLEQIRLEQERKERLKQKEKERKARRKLEGKPVTKKEREAEQRRLAHLEALRQQGISVPEKRQVPEEGKKVKYGMRQRKNKKKQESEDSSTSQQVEAAEYQDVTSTSVKEAEEEDVPDRWDEESNHDDEQEAGETGHVKANWDDESDNEGGSGEQSAEPEKPVLPDKPFKPEKPAEVAVNDIASENESSEESSSEDEESEEDDDLSPFDKIKMRIEKRRMRHENERSEDTLRSPVVCVLGHVDTGKTKILDKIRRTNVQDGEAGGITQQIGATFVPQEAVREQTKMVKEFAKTEIKVPGLLIIDTPGHESFSNLRSRGSSMCDIAILVVDIMHGLEQQTLESLNILRKGKTPFIVALNKIDRLFDWQRNPSGSVRDTLKRQKANTKDEFEKRAKQTIAEFAEQGLNAALFWEKVDFREYIPMVPTSAITGDGMGDLIALLITFSLKMLRQQLMLSMELEALVLEVKVIPGLGTTIDVILRNGVLREGDTLVLTGTEGPFSTTVRALLMPQPLRELRVKNAYVQHKAVLAAQGVKVTSKGELEKTLAGTPVLVAKKAEEVEVLKAEAAEIMKSALSSIKLQERGVYVQASTLGSLEALLEFLKQSEIPYCGVSIGPVHRKDVMKASVMLEHDSQWAVILAFDVRVERDAQEIADNLGVKIFSADIIYHLFDAFLKHRQELLERKRREFEHIAVFPCKLRIMPNCIFNTRDPIVVGVVIEAGLVKPGTPLTVPSKNFTDIGVVSSIEVNHKTVELAKKGEEVCIKVESPGGDAPRLYGRHFDHTDLLVSKISRESIDAVKKYFRDDLQISDWKLMIELKKTFQII